MSGERAAVLLGVDVSPGESFVQDLAGLVAVAVEGRQDARSVGKAPNSAISPAITTPQKAIITTTISIQPAHPMAAPIPLCHHITVVHLSLLPIVRSGCRCIGEGSVKFR